MPFYQRLRHHQVGFNRYRITTQLEEEEKLTNTVDLKAREDVVGVVEDAAKDKKKEMKNKVKMGLI